MSTTPRYLSAADATAAALQRIEALRTKNLCQAEPCDFTKRLLNEATTILDGAELTMERLANIQARLSLAQLLYPNTTEYAGVAVRVFAYAAAAATLTELEKRGEDVSDMDSPSDETLLANLDAYIADLP